MENETQIDTSPPPECGHLDWFLGCPRCFSEMNHIARDNFRLTSTAALTEGAVLFNWHVLLVLADMEKQLSDIAARSLDLVEVATAKNTITNLKQLGMYLVRLAASPRGLASALAGAAAMAKLMQERVVLPKEGIAEEKPTPPTGRVTLTDR